MVPRLPPLFHDGHGRPSVHCGTGQDRLEVLLVHVVGARTGDQASAGTEQPQRPEVDFLVAPPGLLDRILALGEGGGIENHGVEALAAAVEVVQQVEEVGVPYLQVGDAVGGGVRLQPFEGFPGSVHRQHLGRHGRDLEGEAAVVGEAVEDAAMGVHAGGRVVFALVEEEACLLTVVEVGQVDDTVLLDLDLLGHVPEEKPDVRLEPFELAHLRIVPLQDALGLEQRRERLHDLALAPVHALREGLDDQVVAVAVDHEGGQAVALAVDDAVGRCARGHRLAPADRGRQAVAEEANGQDLAALDHAQADLRPRRVEGEAKGAPPRPLDAHHGALGDAAIAGHVGAEDPGVAALDAGLTLAVDDDRAFDRSGLGHFGGSDSGFVSPGAAWAGAGVCAGVGACWGSAKGAGAGGAGGGTGSAGRADAALMLPSRSASSWTARRLAANFPRTRAVGIRLIDSHCTSPSISPSTSTAFARTLALVWPLGPTRRRPRASIWPSKRPSTIKSCPLKVPEKEASSPITATSTFA